MGVPHMLKAADAALRTDAEALALCRRARRLSQAKLRNRAYRAGRFGKRTGRFLPGLAGAIHAAGLTQKQLAAGSGVPRETLSRLETLRRRARLSTARASTKSSFNEVERGGHFAAWEEPELFSQEVRAAFRSMR
jgi:DNA-binding XRE family transcriptional regulator